MKKFKDDVMEVAIESDHPYIDAILVRTLNDLKRCAQIHMANVSDDETVLMNFEYYR